MPRDARHNAKLSNYDFDFFFNGLEEHRLLVQRCSNCSTLRNPPGPICASCRSFDWVEAALSGRGIVYTYTIHYHPRLPEFETPHIVVAAEMDEGVRVVADLAGVAPGDVRIDMPVDVEFYRRGDLATFRFVKQTVS